MINLTQLSIGDPVEGHVLISDKQLARTKDGRAFLRLTVMNKSGSVESTMWNNAEAVARNLVRGQVVHIRGSVTSYQQEMRINIKTVEPVAEEDFDKSDFLPTSPHDVEEMSGEFHRTIRGIKNPFLRLLMDAVFRDPDIWQRFASAPAAKSVHHAYLGGLLEHTLSLAGLVRVVARYYPHLDTDLLTAGALTHDLGKAWEISPELGFEYTDEGRLLGHIQIGLRVLEEKIAEVPDFPSPLALHLKHLVASHHGEPSFGAIKPPTTLEAICLHHLDNLDAKLHGIRQFLEQSTSENENWSPYHPVHQQYFFLPEPHLAPSPPRDDARKQKQKKDIEDPPDLFQK